MCKASLAGLFALAFATATDAQRIPPTPGHTTLESAVASGTWQWRDTPLSVWSREAGLTCVAGIRTFRITRLSPVTDDGAECYYQNNDAGVPIMISVRVGRRGDPPEDEAQRYNLTIPSGMNPEVRREAYERDLGDCDGVLVRFTFSEASGVFPNGTPWTFDGYREISYHLRSRTRSLEIIMRDHTPPLLNDETAVTALAAASEVC